MLHISLDHIKFFMIVVWTYMVIPWTPNLRPSFVPGACIYIHIWKWLFCRCLHAIKVRKFFFYFVYFLSDTLFQKLPLCYVSLGIFFGSLCPHPSRVSSFFLLLFPFTYACSHFWGPVTPPSLFPSLTLHPHHYWCICDNHPLPAPTSAASLHAAHLAMSRPQPPRLSVQWVFSFVFLFCLQSLISKRTPCPLPPCCIPWCAAHHIITPCLFRHVNAAASCVVCRCPGPPFLL